MERDISLLSFICKSFQKRYHFDNNRHILAKDDGINWLENSFLQFCKYMKYLMGCCSKDSCTSPVVCTADLAAIPVFLMMVQLFIVLMRWKCFIVLGTCLYGFVHLLAFLCLTIPLVLHHGHGAGIWAHTSWDIPLVIQALAVFCPARRKLLEITFGIHALPQCSIHDHDGHPYCPPVALVFLLMSSIVVL